MKTRELCWITTFLFTGLAAIHGQPVIVTQPQDQNVVQGESAVFSVEATGSGPIRYQWRRYLNVITFSHISEATNATLVITNAQPTLDRFAVEVSDDEDSVVSQRVRLNVTVPQPPVITRQPFNQNSIIGGTVTFSVSATGDPPLFHQWRYGGTALSGETNDTLTLINLRLEQAGSYDVVVTNNTGSITSQVATLSFMLTGEPTFVTVYPPYAPGLAIEKEGDQVRIHIDGEGILESAPTAAGPWTEMGRIVQTSNLTTSANSEFFRVRNPNPQTVDVLLPSAYDGTNSLPLLIALHGYPLDGDWIDNFFGFRLAAEARGFLYCYPNGIPTGENYFWTGTDACCNFAGTHMDDAGFLRSLIQEIIRLLGADPKRIYLAGHSNGGFMAYRMACEHADLIAGIMSLAGATYATPSACQPSEPVHVLQVHGTADANVSYNGGSINTAFPSAMESVEIWGTYNGATDMQTDSTPSLDLDSNVGGQETVISRFSQHPVGGAVELWTMQGSGHFPDLTDQFSIGVVDWFLNHPKP